MTEPTPLLPRFVHRVRWPSAAPSTSFGAWSGSRTPSARRSPTRREMLKLIASENYASPATLLTMGELVPATSTPRAPIGPPLRRLPQRRHRRGAGRRARPPSSSVPSTLRPAALGIDANLVAFWAVSPTVSRHPPWNGRCPQRQRPVGRRLGRAASRPSATSACSGMSLDAGSHLTRRRPNISGRCSTSAAMAPTRPPEHSTLRGPARHGPRVQAADHRRRMLAYPRSP